MKESNGRTAAKIVRTVVELIDGPKTPRFLAREVGEQVRSTYRRLELLEQLGYARRARRGRGSISDVWEWCDGAVRGEAEDDPGRGAGDH